MVAIIDYDAGNIKSVEKAVIALGNEAAVTRDRNVILSASHVILPGVGAFGDAMEKLHKFDLVSLIHEVIRKETPFLGICLGLQLLFESSEESEGVAGLGILPGRIIRIPDGDGLKIPHIGWNSLCYPNRGRLFQGIREHSFVYFVHSFYLQADDMQIVKATTEYGVTIHASVEKDNVFACQFHPEKSSETGMQILRNFLNVSAKNGETDGIKRDTEAVTEDDGKRDTEAVTEDDGKRDTEAVTEDDGKRDTEAVTEDDGKRDADLVSEDGGKEDAETAVKDREEG